MGFERHKFVSFYKILPILVLFRALDLGLDSGYRVTLCQNQVSCISLYSLMVKFSVRLKTPDE